jgi:hypothetical protein
MKMRTCGDDHVHRMGLTILVLVFLFKFEDIQPEVIAQSGV